MSGVSSIEVKADEADLRLDRWFKQHYPGLTHARLSKLLRTGQIRVDGGRAKASLKLNAGSTVRVPPLDDEKIAPTPTKLAAYMPSEQEYEAARRWVIHRDDSIIVLNKPAGLAVQGGSEIEQHLDALLDGLRFGGPERPRLVHRLDRDTSGVIVLARSAEAARRLTEAFRERSPRKVYWALVIGVPHPLSGRIDAPLAKRPGAGGEKMKVSEKGNDGQSATTFYRVIDVAAPRAAWLALMPKTGRTHQLRVHCAEILGTPIAGDGKYGGAAAFLPFEGIEKRLHLHARALEVPDPADPTGRQSLRFVAEMPPHLAKAFKLLGFDLHLARDPFAALEP
ncbi:MAG: RluA family pseudouridine synthase [Alphaproteobacteria bacterium]|nr:RluA family pseudouridine synthase [Alphaproteobacteria bacterium]